jgi:O-antigen/teichoic acid export membrane protein
MATERKETDMKFDITLIFTVAAVWAVLALAYALAPWSGMIGYAWVWGFGAALFLALGLALRRAARTGEGRA